MAETQQELQKTQAFAQSLHEKIQTDQVKADADARKQEKELEFKREELAAKTRVEMAKLGSAEDRLLLERDLDRIETQAGIEHDKAITAVSLDHEATQAEADREHQSGEAETARQAASEQADLGRKHELTAQELAAKQAKKAAK